MGSSDVGASSRGGQCLGGELLRLLLGGGSFGRDGSSLGRGRRQRGHLRRRRRLGLRLRLGRGLGRLLDRRRRRRCGRTGGGRRGRRRRHAVLEGRRVDQLHADGILGAVGRAHAARAGDADADDGDDVHEEGEKEAEPEHAREPVAQAGKVVADRRRPLHRQHDVTGAHVARFPPGCL
ncbi:MAG: hypothetical protein WDN31_22135 [Hyphomicrobium sp.]